MIGIVCLSTSQEVTQHDLSDSFGPLLRVADRAELLSSGAREESSPKTTQHVDTTTKPSDEWLQSVRKDIEHNSLIARVVDGEQERAFALSNRGHKFESTIRE